MYVLIATQHPKAAAKTQFKRAPQVLCCSRQPSVIYAYMRRQFSKDYSADFQLHLNENPVFETDHWIYHISKSK